MDAIVDSLRRLITDCGFFVMDKGPVAAAVVGETEA